MFMWLLIVFNLILYLFLYCFAIWLCYCLVCSIWGKGTWQVKPPKWHLELSLGTRGSLGAPHGVQMSLVGPLAPWKSEGAPWGSLGRPMAAKIAPKVRKKNEQMRSRISMGTPRGQKDAKGTRGLQNGAPEVEKVYPKRYKITAPRANQQ